MSATVAALVGAGSALAGVVTGFATAWVIMREQAKR